MPIIHDDLNVAQGVLDALAAGKLIQGAADGSGATELAANNSATRKFLVEKAFVANQSQAFWDEIAASDITSGTGSLARGFTGADLSSSVGVPYQATPGAAFTSLPVTGDGSVVLSNGPSLTGITAAEHFIATGDVGVQGGRFTINTGTKNAVLSVSSISNNTVRTFSFPNTDGTFTLNDATQTLTNKTLGATTASGVLTPTAGIAAAGGFAISPRSCHTGENPAMLSTDGTNLSAVVTELYVAEVFIPANCTVTGVAVFWGDATNGNVKVMLFASAGGRLAISASTSVTAYTADSYGSNIPFLAPYSAVGPATYYVGVICDDSTNRINTHTLGAFGAGKITGLVYATESGYASITPPTAFVTGLGPIATLY